MKWVNKQSLVFVVSWGHNLLYFSLFRVRVLMVCLGVTIFLELEFSPLLLQSLFIARGLEDLDFGETFFIARCLGNLDLGEHKV